MLTGPYTGCRGRQRVCPSSQQFKDPLPDTPLTPALVKRVNHPKVAEKFGQIVPENARVIKIEQCLDKEAIILGSYS